MLDDRSGTVRFSMGFVRVQRLDLHLEAGVWWE